MNLSITSLPSFPDDHLFYLSSFLDSASLYRLARTCKIFDKVCNDDRLWGKFVTSLGLKLILNNRCTVLSHINEYNNKIYKLIKLGGFSIPGLEMANNTNKIDVVEAKVLIDQTLATFRFDEDFHTHMVKKLRPAFLEKLHSAIQNADTETATILLEVGVRPTPETFGALHSSPYESEDYIYKEIERIRHTLRHHPELNKAQQSVIALHQACLAGQPAETIQTLLEDLKFHSKRDTPLAGDFLDNSQLLFVLSAETLKLLIMGGARPTTPLLTDFLYARFSAMATIPDPRTGYDQESLEIIKLFISHGAQTEDLALQFGIQSAHPEIVKALMKGWDEPIENALEIARQENASEEITDTIKQFQIEEQRK